MSTKVNGRDMNSTILRKINFEFKRENTAHPLSLSTFSPTKIDVFANKITFT